MAQLNLTKISITLKNGLVQFKTLMDERKSIWLKISFDKRKFIIQNNKDEALSDAYTTWKYLNNNFFGDKFWKESE